MSIPRYKLTYTTMNLKLEIECVKMNLDKSMDEKIQQVLNDHNSFVHILQSLKQRQDFPNCKLILKEKPININIVYH